LFPGELSLPRFRAAAVAALALSSVMLLAGTAAAARADTTDTISVYSVNSPNNDLGSLAVTLESTSPITSVTAHVINAGTQADVLDPAMSQTSSKDVGDHYEGVWTVTSPITTAGLPAGDYTVAVDATDQGGTSVTGVNGGTWQYTSVPTITLNADRLNIDYAHPAANITGTASLQNPDGTTTPYQGPVVVWESWTGDNVTVQSDASGNFSFPASPLYAGGNEVYVLANVQQTTTNRWGQAAMDFSVTQDQAKITATVSPGQVQYGSQATITGTVTYQPAGQTGYVPVTGTPVHLSAFTQYNYSATPDATGVTDATGHFSIPLPKNTGIGWKLEAGAGNTSMLAIPTVNLNEDVLFNAAVTGFAATLNQHWGLSFSGCLALTSNISGASRPPVSNLRLQWASSRTGPWHTISGVKFNAGGPCQYGQRFTGTASAPYNYAFYRVYLYATPVNATTYEGFHAATSNVVLAWKYADRITGLKVSPTTVSRNGRITVKGTLQYYNSGWHNYSGQTIEIILKPKGDTQWYWIVKVKTNSSGQFSATFADPVSAYWAAYYDGNSSHLSWQSGSVYVTVR
jgi:hypothetical protein